MFSANLFNFENSFALQCFFFSLRLLYGWYVESLSFAVKKITSFLLICEEKFFLRTLHPPKTAAGCSALTFRDFVPRLELVSPFRDFLGI